MVRGRWEEYWSDRIGVGIHLRFVRAMGDELDIATQFPRGFHHAYIGPFQRPRVAQKSHVRLRPRGEASQVPVTYSLKTHSRTARQSRRPELPHVLRQGLQGSKLRAHSGSVPKGHA